MHPFFSVSKSVTRVRVVVAAMRPNQFTGRTCNGANIYMLIKQNLALIISRTSHRAGLWFSHVFFVFREAGLLRACVEEAASGPSGKTAGGYPTNNKSYDRHGYICGTYASPCLRAFRPSCPG